jgi:Protein of unknown function (DUF3592)
MSKPILGEAPRSVSSGVAIVTCLGHALTQSGFLLMAFGLVFALVFVRDSELISDREQKGRTWQTADGLVIDSSATGAKENGRRIWQVEYRFSAEGRDLYGRSYTFGRVQGGTPVAVEYFADEPSVSRIQGMRRRKFHQAVGFVLLVPAIGLVLAAIGLLLGRRELATLRNGTVAYGKVVSMTPTHVKINKRRVMKIELDVPSASGTQRVTCRTHRSELAKDDALEQVIFPPDRPDRAVLVDALSRIGVGSEGQLVPRRSAALYFIVPSLAVASWVIAAALVL